MFIEIGDRARRGGTMPKVTLFAGKWSALLGAMGTAGCGVSVAQPISAGVAPTDAEAPDTRVDAPDPLMQGLVAYWKLDEEGAGDVVVDSSGRGHAGMSVDGPIPSTSIPPVRFRDRASRSFDGTSQYVLVSNNDDMNFSGEVTIAAWVNIRAVTAGCHYIVAHGYGDEDIAKAIGGNTLRALREVWI